MADQLALIDYLDTVIHTGRADANGIHRSAAMSADGTYRWSLQRVWDKRPMCAWVMLNPSTADAYTDDPTIRRCMTFARAWGYGGISVVNLYALRSTDPKALWQHPDPIGLSNDDELRFVAKRYPLILLAWGAHAPRDRAGAVMQMMAPAYDLGNKVAVLGWTKGGEPRHPLYMAASTKPVRADIPPAVHGA